MTYDLGFLVAAFLGFLFLVPLLWQHLNETASAISAGFDRQRITIASTRIARMLMGASLVSGLLFLVLLRSLVAASMGVLFVWLVPGWVLMAIQARRRRLFNQQFVDVLILMANSMRAGFNLNQTLDIVSTEMPEPAKTEFGMIIRQRDLGASLDVALDDLSKRMRSESVTIFVTAMLVTLKTGGDLTKVIDKLVKTIRDRERIEDRIRTMTSEGRGQGYVIAALPFLMLAARYFINPESVIRLFNSGWGLAIIIVGTVLDILGLMAIQKVASVKV